MEVKHGRIDWGLWIGTLIGGLGALATVASLKPEEWNTRIPEWLKLLRETLFLYWILIGAAFSFFFLMGRSAGRRSMPSPTPSEVRVVDVREVGAIIANDVAKGLVRRIRVIGYTGETIQDAILYEVQTCRSVDIRLLSRSWIAERTDEDAHNERIATLQHLRPWRKAENIRQQHKHWRAKLVDVRYYDEPPLVRLIHVEYHGGLELAAVGFYDWDLDPEGGGSQHKGLRRERILIAPTDPSSAAAGTVRSLKSQFDRIWRLRSVDGAHLEKPLER